MILFYYTNKIFNGFWEGVCVSRRLSFYLLLYTRAK